MPPIHERVPQLFPIDVRDCTDISLRKHALEGNISDIKFDSNGFRDDARGGLAKKIFYTSPYITCVSCNAIAFVDPSDFKRADNNKSTVKLSIENECAISSESTACPNCGQTNSIAIGAHELTDGIANSERIQTRDALNRTIKAMVIQRAFRFYQSRLYGRAQRRVILIKQLLHDRCAAIIQSMARMKMARRRLKVEQAIKVIRSSPPHLLKRAIDPSYYPNRQSVFWFQTHQEMDTLFLDYYTLVERMGHHHKYHELEANIFEISQRILDRAAALCIRIQSQWRGILMRKFVRAYRRETIRIREIIIRCCMRIQRQFRGWRGRRYAELVKLQRREAQLMQQYLKERNLLRERKNIEEAKHRLHKLYVRERQERKMARYLDIRHEGTSCQDAMRKLLDLIDTT